MAFLKSFLMGSCFLAAFVANAVQPRISYIEKFQTNQILLHFDTEANYTYTLQYTDQLPLPNVTVHWSNLYVAPNYPFPNHYIIADTRTTPQRFYRLQATP